MNIYRWLQLAGISRDNTIIEGSVTFPQNAVEYIAMLAFQKKYESDAHPVVASWFQKNHSGQTKILGQIKQKIENLESSEDGTHKKIAPEFVKHQGRLTRDEDSRSKDPDRGEVRGFKATQIPFQSQGGASDEYNLNPGKDASFGPLSGEIHAKRLGDKKTSEDLKWSDEFKDKIETAIVNALPNSPEGYQLVNIAQHQHGNGHPDVLLIWQKSARDMSENEILSLSSYRDKFIDSENPTEEEISSMIDEIKESIDGVLLWPIHVKTGPTPRFGAIQVDSSMVTTGSAIESILGTKTSFQNLSTKLNAAWRTACQAGGSVKSAESAAAMKTAVDGFKSTIMDWFDEKFKVTQYELRVKGVDPFEASSNREAVTELSQRTVTAELKSFNTAPIIDRASVSVKENSKKKAELEFTMEPEYLKANPGASTTLKIQLNADATGGRVDLNYLPKVSFKNPEELELAITKDWGTTLNLEDFVSGTDENPEYNWEAIEALFGTPFDQVEEDGKITATASRPPMKDHGWFGAAIKNSDLAGVEISLNKLVSTGKLTRDYLKDLGLMESNKFNPYSLVSNLLVEKSRKRISAEKRKALEKKRNASTGKEWLNYEDQPSPGTSEDENSFFNSKTYKDTYEKLKSADKDNSGVVTPDEWETLSNQEKEDLENIARANLEPDNTIRDFEGLWTLPDNIDPDLDMPLEDIWSKIIVPAQKNMSLQEERKSYHGKYSLTARLFSS